MRALAAAAAAAAAATARTATQRAAAKGLKRGGGGGSVVRAVLRGILEVELGVWDSQQNLGAVQDVKTIAAPMQTIRMQVYYVKCYG